MTQLKQYTLTNAAGLSLTVLNYGAIIQALSTATGDNFVLGYENSDDYLHDNAPFYGAVIGCLANRVANGQFQCEQHTYQLEKNENRQHCLHSGSHGLHRVFWDVELNTATQTIECRYRRVAGEAGFPGNVEICVKYQLSDANALTITYSATCDAITPLDLTNHSYWNLGTTDSVLHYQYQFAADHYLPCDADMIPTGEIAPVKNTALDFSQWQTIADKIEPLAATKGYDHYFIANQPNHTLKKVAEVRDPISQIGLSVFSTELGFQFYSGNFLPKPYRGFCIETQNYPNAVNQADFPSPLISPSHPYFQQTVYQLNIPNLG